ncbi:hypothetical protein [Halorussus sp. AFM4]|uniref:hypothetical protein n=1 Tax=Halorussus sp. AFM4 TaxID=3421651 RepID=UPI003EBAD652
MCPLRARYPSDRLIASALGPDVPLVGLYLLQPDPERVRFPAVEFPAGDLWARYERIDTGRPLFESFGDPWFE